MSRYCLLLVALWPLLLPAYGAAATADPEPLEIDRDTTLDPAKTYGRMVITASHVTLDGRGAWLVGSRQGVASEFQATAVVAEGVSDVTLRNLRARGWERGLHIRDGHDWLVENCDFSDNFHDPDFGWGENGRRGGIVIERLSKSVFRGNRASRVWDACVLVGCHDNTIQNNDFSHTSNTCLKLWNSCRNRILHNNLSYGIRIKPGEVHARDSAGVLIESGSDDNYFLDNNCTHGGDGIFIRVLNGWVSAGNLFEQNDCSHANNNCVEAWAPRNKYVGNKANHGSYGFWLGASDQTVLLDNEASHNGLPAGPHNSPHLPDAGHAGIVFMFGPSSHTICRGNICLDNNGAGIALVGDIASKGKKWKAFHWIIEQNTLRGNRWGVYMQYADWVNLAANRLDGNSQAEVYVDGGVTNLLQLPDDLRIRQPPHAALEGPVSGRVGRAVVFDASSSTDPEGRPVQFRWDLGDGTTAMEARVEHRFESAGFYRVGLTVNNGLLSDLAWRDFYVVDDVHEPAAEGRANRWSWRDPGSQVAFSDDRQTRIVGDSSVLAHVEPYSGGRVNLVYRPGENETRSLADKTRLVFWVRAINENLPAWQSTNPVVTLYESAESFARLTPTVDLMSQRPNNEEREGWTYFSVPLAGDEQWKLEGSAPRTLQSLSIGFDSWGAPPLRIWIDGLSFR